MTQIGIVRIPVFLVVFLLVKPVGTYMAKVYEGERTFLDRLSSRSNDGCIDICRIDAQADMPWQTYTIAMLVFTIVGMLLSTRCSGCRRVLPLNPAGMGPVDPSLAFNTAASSPRTPTGRATAARATMSYLTQMAGLTVQNFLSAAAGMAVLVAMIRGLRAGSAKTIGNFWVDHVRARLIYSDAAVGRAGAAAGVAGGGADVVAVQDGDADGADVVPSSRSPTRTASRCSTPRASRRRKTIKVTEQQIAIGPAASQIAIKQLGTNGGGFFNANSAHPFENPTPLSNFLELLAILLIPAALCTRSARWWKDTRQGWAVLAAMTIFFLAGDRRGRGMSSKRAIRSSTAGGRSGRRARQPGGNMEGKEVRFGIGRSALWAAVDHRRRRTARVNSMHDSFTPMGGLVPMVLMQLGESHLRRRGQRAVRHGVLRHHRRVRRRADGRPHAGVPRQEDRSLRDEDGCARRAGHAAGRAVGTALGGR